MYANKSEQILNNLNVELQQLVANSNSNNSSANSSGAQNWVKLFIELRGIT